MRIHEERRTVCAKNAEAGRVVIGCEVHRPDDSLVSPRSKPLLGSLNEHAGCFGVVFRLEKAEKAMTSLMVSVIVVINMCGNTTDGDAITITEKILCFTVLEEGIPFSIEKHLSLKTKRRNPIRVVAVEMVRKVNEMREGAPVSNG